MSYDHLSVSESMHMHASMVPPTKVFTVQYIMDITAPEF